MAIIGRRDEQKELESCLQSDKAEFVVLYEKRRVGKTYLVKEYFRNHFSFYVSGVNNTTNKVQLKNFMTSIEEYGLAEKRKASDWLDAFQALKALLEQNNVYREEKSKKKIIFLDELPWLDGKRSDFKAALDLFWNSYASTKKDIILIVCGEASITD